jgi:YHS domain-containing protein
MYRLSVVVVGVVMFLNVLSAPAASQEIAGVKCVVEGDRNAREQFKAAHADGEVYFCCRGCAAAFMADSSDYQTRANHQLVVTQQYTQTACPIGGEAFDVQQTANVGGVEVAFCCEKCRAQVESAAELPTKAALVFGPAAFKRGFAESKSASAAMDLSKVKCLVDPKRLVKEKFAADHRDGRIFFCCQGCLQAFQAEPSKFSVQANMQLVSTKQYQQTGCPLTDGDADASKTISIQGHEVAFCCGGCQAKVESADEKDRAAMVFEGDAFERAFSKVGKTESKEDMVAPEELAAP